MGEYYEKFGPIMYPSRHGKPKELLDGHELNHKHEHNDECLKKDILTRLESLNLKEVKGLQIQVEKGAVILRGKVSSERVKKFIVDVTDHVLGVKHVQNELEV